MKWETRIKFILRYNQIIMPTSWLETFFSYLKTFLKDIN